MNVQLDTPHRSRPFMDRNIMPSERPFVGLLGRKSSLMAQLGMKLKISQGSSTQRRGRLAY